MLRLPLTCLTATGFLALSAISGASALPGSAAPPAAPETLIQKAHACHRSCEWGPVLGWHRHVGGCHPVACLPRAASPNRCFVNRYGQRICRW